jgi:crotonobetainyl-CoA:carnitine CoA-transferase CaiB-like acyl-CoA transferase
MTGAYQGIRVLDLSEYIAGPLCGMLLVDMGADVIKVEPPRGDNWRHVQPVVPGESRLFLAANRGKKSVCLDMTAEEGRAIVQRLAHRADVMIVNFRAGVAERLGLDYETLAAANPGLIYCRNTAFGQAGPGAGRAGFDLVAQAAGGLMALQPQPGTLPGPLPLPAVDLAAAMLLFGGVGAALHARCVSGRGQQVDTSLLAAALTLQNGRFVSIEQGDRPLREGWLEALRTARGAGAGYDEIVGLRREALGAPPPQARDPYRGVYQTRDGLLAYTCVTQRLRQRLMALLGLHDPRREGGALSAEEEAETVATLSACVAELLQTRTTADWLEEFGRAGIPAGPVRFVEELFEEPGVVDNGLVAECVHQTLGPLKMLGIPIVMSGTPGAPQGPPPALGQHTDEVLATLGYDAGQIEELRARGVVA